tara:strand:- start:14312 stop:14539 length:228 start_codon:yes stop_codon:yes gene_type:complete
MTCLSDKQKAKLENNERILNLIKERLDKGAEQYGKNVPIDGSRDNLKEALDEVLDLCVYLSATLLELHDVYKNKK